MRRFTSLCTCVVVAALCAGVGVRAGDTVQTGEELDKTMKKIAAAQQTVSKAIQATAYADAKRQLDLIQAALKDAQRFWIVNKREDAARFTQETVAKIDNLVKLLAAKTPDAVAITAGYREVGTACATCHRVYRATDENNNFILKPGALR
jgi:cytochrome c556